MYIAWRSDEEEKCNVSLDFLPTNGTRAVPNVRVHTYVRTYILHLYLYTRARNRSRKLFYCYSTNIRVYEKKTISERKMKCKITLTGRNAARKRALSHGRIRGAYRHTHYTRRVAPCVRFVFFCCSSSFDGMTTNKKNIRNIYRTMIDDAYTLVRVHTATVLRTNG